ncbi:unnamed protein product [Ixodes hexagonus]
MVKGARRSEPGSSNTEANPHEITVKSKKPRPHSKLKTEETASVRLSEDDHVPKRDSASRKLDGGSVLDDNNSEHTEVQDVRVKKVKKKKLKTEVTSERCEAAYEVQDDNSEGVESVVPDKKAKKEKKRRAGIENDGASGQSSPRKQTRQGGAPDEGEGKVVKAKKVKRKKKNRRAPPEATKNTKDQCLQYLKDWQGPSWKFCKNKQFWLLSHAFEEDMIPEDDFEILLRYIEGLKGAARERLQQSANKFLESANEDNDGDDDIDAAKYERARLILQMLD